MKDDMSDDEQFEAFLKGEGSLARQLQALQQPAPSAALDAAILGQAREAAQQARPQAANDGAPLTAPSRHPARLSWRWQVPAGIAATVLVGLVARQSFESDTAAQVYEAAPAIEAAMPEKAPPAAASAPVVQESASDPVTVASGSGSAADTARLNRAAKVDDRSVVVPALRLPAPSAPPAAPPAPPAAADAATPPPVAEAAPAAAPATGAQANAGEQPRMRKARSAPVRQEQSQKPVPSEYRVTASSPASGNVPAPARFSYSADGFSAAPPPAALQPQEAAPAASAPIRKQAFPVIIRDSEPAVHPVVETAPTAPEPADVMLARIEALLEAGKQAEAAIEWKRMRIQYPDYPVPDTTREKLRGN